MRPIHGLIGLAVLALLLIGGLFLWTKDDPAHAPGADSPSHAATEAAPTPAALELTAAAGTTPERTVEVVPTGPAAGRDARAGAEGQAQRVSGRVIDAAGKPVANALVYAAAGGTFDDLALDEVDPVESPWFQRADARTDSAGKFALDPKINARVRLAVRAGGFAPLDVERTISATNPEVGDLVLQAGVVLEGRVIDHLGRPVAGAELRRRRIGAGPLSFFTGRGGAVAAKSDAGGAFRIDMLAVGAWNLRITSDVAPDKDESGETTRIGEVVRGLTIQLEEGLEIAGKVTGIPAEEAALLRVVAVPSRGDFGGDFSPGMGIGQRLAPVAADGSFTVRGCKKEGKYRISARLVSDGLSSMLRSPTRSPTADATAGERGLVLVYRAETALVFQVLDAATGAPVTSMSVAAGTRWAAPLMDDKNRPVHEFPDGRVRYGGLRLGGGGGRVGGGGSSEGVTLRVESPGFAPYERKDVPVTEGADNDLGIIRLEHTWLVKVHVTEAGSGAPVSGARVRLEEIQDDPGAGRMFAFRTGGGGDDDDFDFGGGNAQRGKTDADGRVSVSSIPGSRGRLVVTHRQFSEFRSEPIDLPRGVDIEREVLITSGGTIVVKVVDATGAPVANEGLDHRGPNEQDSPMFFGPGGPLATDADGLLTLPHQTVGVHGFRLQSAAGPRMFGGGGGMRMARTVRMEGGDAPPEAPWTELTVTEGGQHELTLAAPERARVVGRVREGGRALAGATVRLRTKGGDDAPFFEEGPKAETDGLGEYALENVTVGEYVLTVSHPTRAMPHESDLRVGSGETRENVELPLSILEGRITDEEGKGVAGLRVRAERQAGGDRVVREFVFAVDSGDGPVSFGSGGGGQVTTNAEGRYTLRGVVADTDLTVVATGQGVQRTESESVRVPVDGTRSGVDLVARKGAGLEVTCRRPDGSAATPCEVRAELQAEDDSDMKLEITRGDGKARFQGLKPGRWRVTARDLGTGPDERERTPTEQTIELKVGPVPQQLTLEIRGS